jgi:hypothetical protein
LELKKMGCWLAEVEAATGSDVGLEKGDDDDDDDDDDDAIIVALPPHKNPHSKIRIHHPRATQSIISLITRS